MTVPRQTQQRQIRIGIRSDDISLRNTAIVQHRLDASRAVDNVIVGERIAIRRNDHAGACAIIEIASAAGAPNANNGGTDRIDYLNDSF